MNKRQAKKKFKQKQLLIALNEMDDAIEKFEKALKQMNKRFEECVEHLLQLHKEQQKDHQ